MFFLFLDAETMHKEVPQAGDLVNDFRARTLENGRGRGNIDTVVVGNPSVAGIGTSIGAGRSRKRTRKASNIATTTRSLGGMSIPPRCPSPMNLESPPSTSCQSIRRGHPCHPDFEVSLISPRGDMEFSRGIGWSAPHCRGVFQCRSRRGFAPGRH